MPRPVLRTIVPRLRPSVGFMQITRTRLSPICCATSAVMWMVLPSSSASISTAKLISGSASWGNSTSTTGPAMATTRPSLRAPLSVEVVSAVTVIAGLLLFGFRAVLEQIGIAALDRVGEEVVDVALLPGAQGLGPTDDLHDLGGDRVLTGAVHHAGEVHDQVVGIVGGGLHGPLARRVLRCGGVEQRGEHERLHVARQEEVEDRVGRRLELVRRLDGLGLPGGRVGLV